MDFFFLFYLFICEYQEDTALNQNIHVTSDENRLLLITKTHKEQRKMNI